MAHPQVDDVVTHARGRLEATLERLSGYLRIPAISCDPSHAPDVGRLAEKIRADLEALGMRRSRVLRLDGALPLIAAEWLDAGPRAPTVLIYGHLDLQPVAGEPWSTPPHEPTRRGDRLYARGAADDMGGWVSHIASIESWLAVTGGLPVNVKLVIESEEEIGSPNLVRYMDAHPDVFEAHAMVLTDCENPSIDIPGLTVSLRGIYEVEVVCEALTSDVHSGLWGNMVPDPSMALVKLLARLVDDDGRMVLGRADVDPAWQRAAWGVPLDAEVVRRGGHVRNDVAPLPDRGHPPAEWLWRQPAVTVLSTTMPRPSEHKNAVRAAASAWLSIRLAPGQTRDQMRRLLEGALLSAPTAGVRVSLNEGKGGSESWLYRPSGPAFDAANRAYAKAWGRPLLEIGVGGSIPFVALFGKRFGDLPLILNGVMDPETGAHGPNESLHLGVFEKALAANAYLLDELASALRV
jgi:acetylornithine deacetylase/succinyl-diaminopimelate desuccinylase-like protein